MALTKNKIIDKAETVKIQNYYVIQIRECNQILEDDQEISSSFHRYVLKPDADTSTISDSVVLAQFNAVMTSEVKANYQAFLESNPTNISE
jgi:hypothetical protein